MAKATLVVNRDRTAAVFNSERAVIQRIFRGLVASLSDQLVEFYPDEKTKHPGDRIIKVVSGMGLREATWKILGDRLGQQMDVEVTTTFI